MKQWLAAASLEDVRKFYDEKYEKNGLEQFKGGDWEPYKRLLREVGGEFSSDKRLLDAGCGHGEFLASFGHAMRITGIEISQAAVRLARKRLNQGIVIKNISIEEFEPMGYFNYITCLGALEHSMHPVDNFKALYSMLFEGGCLLIVVPLEFENCLSAIEHETNKITNERFMTADEWISLFEIKPVKTEVINQDIALVYKKEI